MPLLTETFKLHKKMWYELCIKVTMSAKYSCSLCSDTKCPSTSSSPHIIKSFFLSLLSKHILMHSIHADDSHFPSKNWLKRKVAPNFTWECLVLCFGIDFLLCGHMARRGETKTERGGERDGRRKWRLSGGGLVDTWQGERHFPDMAETQT